MSKRVCTHDRATSPVSVVQTTHVVASYSAPRPLQGTVPALSELA